MRRGLAIDVAVICPLADSHLSKPEPCESYAQHQKIDRYVGAFENSDYDFAPVIFETCGAVNKEGETVLKQIIRFASKRRGPLTPFMPLVPGRGSLAACKPHPRSKFLIATSLTLK